MVRRSLYKSTRKLFNNNKNVISSRLHINMSSNNVYNYMYSISDCHNETIENAIKVALEKIIIPFREEKFYNIDGRYYMDLLEIFNKNKEYCNTHYLALESISAAMLGKSLYYKSVYNDKKVLDLKNCIDDLKEELSQTKARLKKCLNEENSNLNQGAEISVTVEVDKQIPILKYIAKINIFTAWYYFIYGFEDNKRPSPEQVLYIKNLLGSLGENATSELYKRIDEEESKSSLAKN